MDIRIAQYRFNGELMRVHPSFQSAVGVGMIKAANLERALDPQRSFTGISKGYIWRALQQNEVAPRKIDPLEYLTRLRKPTAAYTLDGVLHSTYDSQVSAAKGLDVVATAISRAICHPERVRRVAQYMFRVWDGFTQPPQQIDPIPPHHLIVCVARYDTNGNLLEVYDSMTQAAEATNTPYATVSTHSRKIWLHSHGYWRRFEYGSMPVGKIEIPEDPIHQMAKPVVQLDVVDGQELGVFASIAEAARATGVERAAIGAALTAGKKDGRTHTSGGYVWRYLTDYLEENK